VKDGASGVIWSAGWLILIRRRVHPGVPSRTGSPSDVSLGGGGGSLFGLDYHSVNPRANTAADTLADCAPCTRWRIREG